MAGLTLQIEYHARKLYPLGMSFATSGMANRPLRADDRWVPNLNLCSSRPYGVFGAFRRICGAVCRLLAKLSWAGRTWERSALMPCFPRGNMRLDIEFCRCTFLNSILVISIYSTYISIILCFPTDNCYTRRDVRRVFASWNVLLEINVTTWNKL